MTEEQRARSAFTGSFVSYTHLVAVSRPGKGNDTAGICHAPPHTVGASSVDSRRLSVHLSRAY